MPRLAVMDSLSSISDSGGTSWASDVRSALSDGCWKLCHEAFSSCTSGMLK